MKIVAIALLVALSGCAAMTAEKYGSHQRVEIEFPSAAVVSSSAAPVPVAPPAPAPSVLSVASVVPVVAPPIKIREEVAIPVVLAAPAVDTTVKEGVVKLGLCEPRPRKAPINSNVKYIVVGSDPVDPDRYYDPSTEVLFYLLKDKLLTVEKGKYGKTTRGWVEEGTVIVADKSTYKALRVCKCGNGIRDKFFFDAINTANKKGGG